MCRRCPVGPSPCVDITARQRLWDKYRKAIEPGGVTAFVGLFSGAYQPGDGERIALILCGANSNPPHPGLTSPLAAPEDPARA